MRHVLGVLGVLAAGVLLAVSAAMNWRFGYTLGKTELDGQIYGAASAAADCFKALVPFFFFAAIKNRMWSQAAASAVVWIVVTAYSLTSALGHAMQNRQDVSGQRTVQAQTYKDLRGQLKTAEDQLSWIPQHRPAMAVVSELSSLKNQREWTWTKGCTEGNLRGGLVTFCQKVHALGAELASAQQADTLRNQIAELRTRLDQAGTGTVHSDGDPQAAVLAKLVNWLGVPVKVEDVQTSLAVFVALLLEVGSGFGMYVAFSTWRLYDRNAPKVPQMVTVPAVATTPLVSTGILPVQKTVAIANDNRSLPAQRMVQPPDNDVERYRKDCIEQADGSSLTATELYESYCTWCEKHEKEPLALPTFSKEFGELGVPKARLAGRVRYVGVSFKKDAMAGEDRSPAVPASQAA